MLVTIRDNTNLGRTIREKGVGNSSFYSKTCMELRFENKIGTQTFGEYVEKSAWNY